MRTLRIATPLILVIGSLCAAHAQNAAGGRPVLSVVGDSRGQTERLVLTLQGKELSSIALPPAILRPRLARGLQAALWHPNGSAVAVALKMEKGTFVVAFILQDDGSYVATDVSDGPKGSVLSPERRSRTRDYQRLVHRVALSGLRPRIGTQPDLH